MQKLAACRADLYRADGSELELHNAGTDFRGPHPLKGAITYQVHGRLRIRH